MKKIINIFLIIIILINTLLPYKSYAIDTSVLTNTTNTSNTSNATNTTNTSNTSNTSNSTNTTNSTTQQGQSTSTEGAESTEIPDESFANVEEAGIKDINSITEGQATVNGNKQPIEETGSMFTTVTSIVCGIIAIIPKTVDFIMTVIVRPYQETSYNGGYDGELSEYEDEVSKFKWFTIQDLVLGKINLFNANFFDLSAGSNVDDNPNILMKENVRTWYYSVNQIAIIANLLVLIYVGIRMAISTVAEEQARYKTMLFDWIGSLIILFALPYILTFIFAIADTLLKLLPQITGKENFEALLTTKLYDQIIGDKADGAISIITSTITLIILTMYQVKFFFKYFIRFIKIGFLVVISPIITITYSIDKKSAYNIWLKELLGAIFMQLVNAIMYIIFIISASEIATKAPLITVAFFMALSKGEKIFYALFKLKEN